MGGSFKITLFLLVVTAVSIAEAKVAGKHVVEVVATFAEVTTILLSLEADGWTCASIVTIRNEAFSLVKMRLRGRTHRKRRQVWRSGTLKDETRSLNRRSTLVQLLLGRTSLQGAPNSMCSQYSPFHLTVWKVAVKLVAVQ